MEELQDMPYNPAKPKRRTNSFTHTTNNLKSKFEVAEEAPLFEEGIHGATAPDFQNELQEMEKLEKRSTSSSMDSVEDKE